MNVWKLVYRFALMLAAVFFVVGMVCLFLPRCRRYHELQQQKRALEKETIVLESRVEELKSRQSRMRDDPAFVERMAREQGMAKPGETVFRLATGMPAETP